MKTLPRKPKAPPDKSKMLAARPLRLIDAAPEQKSPGKWNLTAPMRASKWAGWLLRLPAGATRTFQLDELGKFAKAESDHFVVFYAFDLLHLNGRRPHAPAAGTKARSTRKADTRKWTSPVRFIAGSVPKASRQYRSLRVIPRSPRCTNIALPFRIGVVIRREFATIRSTSRSLMPLGPGTRLGPYEIVSAIGTGDGRGLRATDTNLGRQVAIKILPDASA